MKIIEEQIGTREHPYHSSYGGIVYRTNPQGDLEILLLHKFKKPGWEWDSWHLPKGTKRTNEFIEETVSREIKEEAGYRVVVGKKIGELPSAYLSNGGFVVKKTTYYFACEPIEEVPGIKPEYDEVKWVAFEEAVKLLSQIREWEYEEEILQEFKKMKDKGLLG